MPLVDVEKRREYGKTYRAFHAEEARANNRAYHAENKDVIRARKKMYMPSYTAKTTAHRRDAALQRNYGITSDDYERMLVQQEGRCAICGTSEPGGNGKFFSVDHNHTTKRVRGLLCGHCNTGLGKFKEDPQLLMKAVSYLQVWQT